MFELERKINKLTDICIEATSNKSTPRYNIYFRADLKLDELSQKIAKLLKVAIRNRLFTQTLK